MVQEVSRCQFVTRRQFFPGHFVMGLGQFVSSLQEVSDHLGVVRGAEEVEHFSGENEMIGDFRFEGWPIGIA